MPKSRQYGARPETLYVYRTPRPAGSGESQDAEETRVSDSHGTVEDAATEVVAPVPSIYSSDLVTPPAAGIRDGAHRRVAPLSPCPGSAAAHSEAQVSL